MPLLRPPGVKGMEPMRPRTNSRVPCRAAMGRRASASRSAASCFDVNSRPQQAAGNSEELAMSHVARMVIIMMRATHLGLLRATHLGLFALIPLSPSLKHAGSQPVPHPKHMQPSNPNLT